MNENKMAGTRLRYKSFAAHKQEKKVQKCIRHIQNVQKPKYKQQLFLNVPVKCHSIENSLPCVTGVGISKCQRFKGQRSRLAARNPACFEEWHFFCYLKFHDQQFPVTHCNHKPGGFVGTHLAEYVAKLA